jgi:hypothetical protein
MGCRLRLPLFATAGAVYRLMVRILCQYAFGQGKICDAICHPVTSRFIGGNDWHQHCIYYADKHHILISA